MSYEAQQELGALMARPDEANITRAEALAEQQPNMWWPWLDEAGRSKLGALLNSGDPALAARVVALIVKLSRGQLQLQDMELEVVPPALEAHAGELRFVNLQGNRLRALPGWLLGAPKLESLNVANNYQLSELPAPTPASTTLNKLQLGGSAIKALPDDLHHLSALKALELPGAELTELPDSIGQLVSLEELDLERNKLTALPDAIAALTGLKKLNLKGNKLTELPEVFASMSALDELLLSGNKLTKFPMVLLSMSLKEVDGIPGYMKKPKKPELLKFLRKLKMVSLPTDVRHRIFEMFEDDKQTQTFGLIRHFEAQQVDYEPLRSRAMKFILSSEPNLYSKTPLREGAIVAVLGKITLKKTEIKEKFTRAKLVYSPTITDKVTHVVVEPGAKDFYSLDTLPCAFMTEKQLVDYLDNFEDNFLLEKDEQTQESVGNVAEMLMSVDEASQALGIEMLKAGGVPATLMTELFIIATFAEDAKLKEAAKKLIKLHGTKGAQDAVKDRTKILSTAYDKVEKLTSESIAYYNNHYGRDIDFIRVAMWMVQRFGRGARFVLDREKPGSPHRAALVSHMIKDGALDLYSWYATYRPDYFNPYSYYDKLNFPPEILDHPEIVELDAHGCNLGALPANIDRLVNLKRLRLNHNMIAELPDSLEKLKNLEVIELACNELKEFPAVLGRMPWLKKIDLHDNRQDKTRHPLTPSDEERRVLSRCSLILD